MLKIIDVGNKGYASKEDIQGMTLEQLKQIANEVDGDPANTEEYEFALFEIDSVRYELPFYGSIFILLFFFLTSGL